jgi:hypothetical protein
MKMVVISDLHSGHRFGLTPPTWQFKDKGGFYSKVANFQKELWDWYVKEIESEKPINLLVSNGDLIDGKGFRSGGTELIVADRNEQIMMAKQCIEVADSKRVMIVNGTPYHTGSDEDFEAMLAELLHAEYSNHLHLDFGGVKFDFKHKVSSSIIPHGRYTAPRREAVWNALWYERGMLDKVDVVVRSHVHYYSLSEDAYSTVITSPCLQGYSKYGSRECSGTNDLGFLVFDCEDGNMKMTKHIFDMKKFKVEFTKY